MSGINRINRIKWALVVAAVLIGALLLLTSNAIHSDGAYGRLPQEFLKELGVAFLVAAIVGTLFDLAFHGAVIDDSMERLKGEMTLVTTTLEGNVKNNLNKLGNTISNMNNVLRGAEELKIIDLYHRVGRESVEEWRNDVIQTMKKAEKFIYVTGKTLEVILARESITVKELILEKLSKPEFESVKFLVADPYSEKSAFRKESNRPLADEIQDGEKPHKKTKDALTRLYALKYGTKQISNSALRGKLHLKILSDELPFTLVITDKHLLVQHYLPYQDTKIGLFIKVGRPEEGANSHSLYDTYLHSFERMFDSIEEGELKRAIEEYFGTKDSKDRQKIVEKYIPRFVLSELKIDLPPAAT